MDQMILIAMAHIRAHTVAAWIHNITISIVKCGEKEI